GSVAWWFQITAPLRGYRLRLSRYQIRGWQWTAHASYGSQEVTYLGYSGREPFPAFPDFPGLEREQRFSVDADAAHATTPTLGVERRSSVPRVALAKHGPDRLVADTKVGGQHTEALGAPERADRGLLIESQLANTGAI